MNIFDLIIIIVFFGSVYGLYYSVISALSFTGSSLIINCKMDIFMLSFGFNLLIFYMAYNCSEKKKQCVKTKLNDVNHANCVNEVNHDITR